MSVERANRALEHFDSRSREEIASLSVRLIQDNAYRAKGLLRLRHSQMPERQWDVKS